MPGAVNQPGQHQPAGPENGESFEAGESEGPDDDGPEEMEAGGFDVPEPEESSDANDAPAAPTSSAPSDFAPSEPEEPRRDKPGSSDDEVQ